MNGYATNKVIKDIYFFLGTKMNSNLNEYSKITKLNGLVKVTLMNENVALLETNKKGLLFLSQFIETEIINDSENDYSFKHFSYLPQIGEDDLAQGSLDFFIEKIDGFVDVPSKKGKTYLQYGISSIVTDINRNDDLFEANSYINVEQRDNLLVSLSCNKLGFISFCKLLNVMASNELNKIHLYPEKKSKNVWGELNEGSMELVIVKREE